ncbi:MAG: hypothetical protein ACFFB2_08060 [Promethearchaeota archaeon]
MTNDKHKFYQKELIKIDRQLQTVTGIKARHKLLRRQNELKKELRYTFRRKK